jgi:hypothetical protein
MHGPTCICLGRANSPRSRSRPWGRSRYVRSSRPSAAAAPASRHRNSSSSGSRALSSAATASPRRRSSAASAARPWPGRSVGVAGTTMRRRKPGWKRRRPSPRAYHHGHRMRAPGRLLPKAPPGARAARTSRCSSHPVKAPRRCVPCACRVHRLARGRTFSSRVQLRDLSIDSASICTYALSAAGPNRRDAPSPPCRSSASGRRAARPRAWRWLWARLAAYCSCCCWWRSCRQRLFPPRSWLRWWPSR